MTNFDPEAGVELKTAFDSVVLEWPAVTGKSMFGCPSYQADGTLFAVLVTDGVALTRLPEDRREELEASFDVHPFDAGGRSVTKWAQVTVGAGTDLDALLPYVEASYQNAVEESSD